MSEGIIVAIISSGIVAVTAIIELLRYRHKDKAEARLAQEQADSEDLTQRKTAQEIIAAWETRYGELVARLDNERTIRENIQRTTTETLVELRRDLENERDARQHAETRANGQAQHLAQLRAQVEDMERLVHDLSAENNRLRLQVEAMQSTIDEQAAMIARLKAELIKRDAKIVSLQRQCAVSCAELKLKGEGGA